MVRKIGGPEARRSTTPSRRPESDRRRAGRSTTKARRGRANSCRTATSRAPSSGRCRSRTASLSDQAEACSSVVQLVAQRPDGGRHPGGARHRFDHDLRGAALREFLGRRAHGGRRLRGLRAQCAGSACRPGRDRSAPSSARARSGSRATMSRCARCAARARSRSRSRRSPLNMMIESTIRFFFGGDTARLRNPVAARLGDRRLQDRAAAIRELPSSRPSRWRCCSCSCAHPTGKAMRAVADNPMLADSRASTRTAWRGSRSASAWGSPASAACWSGSIPSIDPLVGFRAILSVFAAAVVGGLGSIPGAVVGGLAIGLAEELSLLALPVDLQVGRRLPRHRADPARCGPRGLLGEDGERHDRAI